MDEKTIIIGGDIVPTINNYSYFSSGDIYICKDKSTIDFVELKNKVNKWLKSRYYWRSREFPYKDIKPKIICEKYMVDSSGFELKDYKFWCFNGVVKYLYICLNRHKKPAFNVDYYELDWKPMPIENHYRKWDCSGQKLEKPKNYNKMIEFSKYISKDIPFLRVDFYEANEQLYFGELTFFPGSGFEIFRSEEFDNLMGSWLELPK